MKNNCKIIAIANQKGETGKTTTVISLATMLTKMGKKVLAVDADPQGNLTMSQGIFQPDEIERSLSKLLYHYAQAKVIPDNLSEYIRYDKDFDYLSDDVMLSTFDLKLSGVSMREFVFKKVIDNFKKDYDYILIDCSPTLGLLLYNIFTAADSVLVPVQAQFYSAKGLELLTQTYAMVRGEINPELKIEGVLLTMADARTTHPNEILALIKEHFGKYIKIYDGMIPCSVNVSRGQSKALSIYETSSCEDIAVAYTNFAKEFLNHA